LKPSAGHPATYWSKGQELGFANGGLRVLPWKKKKPPLLKVAKRFMEATAAIFAGTICAPSPPISPLLLKSARPPTDMSDQSRVQTTTTSSSNIPSFGRPSLARVRGFDPRLPGQAGKALRGHLAGGLASSYRHPDLNVVSAFSKTIPTAGTRPGELHRTKSWQTITAPNSAESPQINRATSRKREIEF